MVVKIMNVTNESSIDFMHYEMASCTLFAYSYKAFKRSFNNTSTSDWFSHFLSLLLGDSKTYASSELGGLVQFNSDLMCVLWCVSIESLLNLIAVADCSLFYVAWNEMAIWRPTYLLYSAPANPQGRPQRHPPY
jgi:hypothetical protein